MLEMEDVMEDHVYKLIEIPFNNIKIPITNVVVMSWLAMAIIILWAYLATRKMQTVPRGLQNTAELVVEAISKFANNIIGHDGKKFVPYLGTIALFLAIVNTVGALFMTEVTHGVVGPATRSLGVTAALAIMTIVIATGAGIWKKGFLGFLKSLFKPLPVMFPFKVLDLVIKPLSLCMRLYGNILAAFILMEMIFQNEALRWGLPAIVCLYFDLFDGGLQAFVFVLLTALYISEEVETE